MSTLRITGLATGLDIDSLVKQMMQSESVKIDKVKQDRQLVQWRQDIYREILGDINTFKSTYFDILKKDTYVLSNGSYSSFDITTKNADGSSNNTVLGADASTDAVAGNYYVTVTKLAKSASSESTSLNQSGTFNIANWLGQELNFTVDGVATKKITLDASYSGTNDTEKKNELIQHINDQIAVVDSGLKGKLQAVADGSTIKFIGLTDNNIKLQSTTVTTDLDNLTGRTVNPTLATKLSGLGMTDNATTLKLDYKDPGTGAAVTKTINLSSSDTINDVINNIRTETSGGLVVRFSDLTKTFSIQTMITGSSQSLGIDSPSASFLSALGIKNGTTYGDDSEISIDPPGDTGATIVKRSTNNFVVDGITYNLLEESNQPIKMTLTSNPQKIFDKVKGFIDKYNEIIDKVNKELDKKKQYDYKPLTDDQKKDMKDDDIKAWEEKAKEGILRNDSSLQNMLYSLRNSFFDKVEGTGISLTEVGLTTDSDYSNKGKIVIDETKLKKAIQERGDQVVNLFMKDSDIDYDLDHKKDKERYNQVGIFQRINDILKDYTRTTRNTDGRKGILIEIAGIKGDVSEFNSILSKELRDNYDKKIYNLTKMLAAKENKYYMDFSKLEVAMQRMNEQSNWLATQLGSMGGN